MKNLTGHAAIEAVENDDNLQLNHYTTPIDEAAEDITVEKAEEIAAEDPNLIFATRRGESVW
ncbi:MAG: hypothetical protein M0P69_03655 [Bacteroidales bacterium]|nr:hypothetical protein [Bacteroidales bacterium]